MFLAGNGNRRRRRITRKHNSRRQAKRVLHLEQLESRQLLHAGHGLELANHEHSAETTPIVETAALAAVSPTALLPDLIPWVDQAKGFLYGWTVQGQELRLTSAMANIGTGALEIRGGAVLDPTTQEVHQRIYEPDGTFTDRVAGTFTYHPEHKHIHFDGFAEFRLREVLPGNGVGAIIAGGLKTSFCIIDIENYDSDVPARYLTCKQVQGLSPGWADLYDRGLPGQSINITNIQNGTYWLEMAVDPDGHIVESNESNNEARILIDLQRDGAPTNADTFEPNDSFAAASILAPPEDHLYENLSIHETGNADYFRVTASATGKLTVSLAFQNSQGDIELAVHNAAQTRLGISQTSGNAEKVTVDAVAGEIFYIRVFGYDGDTNPNYSMLVDQPETDDAESGDSFEDNDSFAAAKSLSAIDQVYNNLSILRPNDHDYYSIVPTTSGSLAVNLAFVNSQGNLDLEIYDSSQSRIGVSATTGDGEQLRVPVTAGQAYYIKILDKNGATNPNYSMAIDMIDAGTTTAYYLSTTAGGTLASTDGSPSLSFADSDILKLIVRGDGLYHYELHFDGSDVGLSGSAEDIDAFAFRADGSILVSTTGSFSVPAPGGTLTGTRSDLLLFTPTSLGETTTGVWSLYFDGSDVGLSASSENIDAIAELSDGRLLISATGGVSVSGASGQDEDLFAFAPTSLGSVTAGAWSLYFDGTDVGLTANDAEDVNALFVTESGGLPTLYFSTVGNFSVPGVSGANDDVLAFRPTTLGATTAGSFGPGLEFDGGLYGLASFAVDGIHFNSPAAPLQAVARSVSIESTNAAPLSVASVVSGEQAQQQQPKPKAKTAAKNASKNALRDLTALTMALNKSKPAKEKSAETNESDCGCSSNDAEPAKSAKGRSNRKHRGKAR